MAVATAMAYPPSTNSITRSATYSEVTAPGPIRSIFSEVAKTVSTKKFTWEIPMPKNPGTISRATALTPGCVKETPKLKRIPCRTSRGSCTRNCSAPPTRTPTASATALFGKCRYTTAMENVIMEIFNRMGVAAGGPKIWKQFRIAMASADKPMKKM